MTTNCEGCMPRIKDILDVAGDIMTETELTAVKKGIEALGGVLRCRKDKLTCLPLAEIETQMVKNKEVKGGKLG